MFGLILMRKKKFEQLLDKEAGKQTGPCYRLGYMMGQVEERNRHFISVFGISELLSFKQAQIILEQNEKEKGEL